MEDLDEPVAKFANIDNFEQLILEGWTMHVVLEGLQRKEFNTLTLDWTDVTFASPAFLTMQALLLHHAYDSCGIKCMILFPRVESVKQYLANCHFIDKYIISDTGYKPKPIADFIGLENFRSTDYNIIERISEFCLQHLPPVPDLWYNIENSFAELMDNAIIHSQSLSGGCIMAQFYPNIRRIRICICDFGVSIPRHLERKKEFSGLDDSSLIERAFEPGITGADHQRSGMGMDFVRDFTLRLGGVLRVYSGKGQYLIRQRENLCSNVAFPFPGTIYSIDWPSS